ncbi:MAG TPA: Gfo/Idh/MocA family oxidoreductase [Conexibacter sp.]|nr:Gfo/Idh/MocA family oxidoreductase [Conexibacter sp.]
MRVALAGLGNAAVRGHLPALRRLAHEGALRLVGVADPDADRRALASNGHERTPGFESAEALLGSVDCDVLVIAAEPASHAQLTTLGARHGVHVVCEKPLTLTREQHERVAAAYADRTGPALVAVHQYRYSPAWTRMLRWARLVERAGARFELSVEVQRHGTDARAATAWRDDPARSGGMLADHGVHFLSLGCTISDDIEALHCERAWDDRRRERAHAKVRVGTGLLELRLSAAAPRRGTRVELRTAPVEFGWRDEQARISVAGRALRSWRTEALSDRRHVDALYLPLYRDLVGGWRSPRWRALRTREALTVSGTLVELLERSPFPGGAP